MCVLFNPQVIIGWLFYSLSILMIRIQTGYLFNAYGFFCFAFDFFYFTFPFFIFFCFVNLFPFAIFNSLKFQVVAYFICYRQCDDLCAKKFQLSQK